jgi:hypothetical protein
MSPVPQSTASLHPVHLPPLHWRLLPHFAPSGEGGLLATPWEQTSLVHS